MLVSEKGLVILSRDFVPLEEKLLPGMLPSTSMGSSGWLVARNENGADMLVGFARVELNHRDFSFSTPWTVIVSQELRYAFAPVRRLIWYTSLPGLALILIFFFLGVYLAAGRVASPLRYLTETVKRVASGDMRRTVELKSKDEIGELAAAFNQMVSNLEKRSSLDSMTMNMLSNRELNDVLSMTVDALRITFNAAFARIWLVGDGDLCDECMYSDICMNKDKCLHLKVTVGMYAKDEEYRRVPIGSLKVGKVAETKRPTRTNNLQKDPDVHNQEWLQKEGLVSFAAHPLLIGNELLGVLALFCRKSISDEESRILGSFTHHTSMAIQNAMLHSEIRGFNLNLEQKVDERTRELELANAKLRKADQMKSDFLANMSHELRTPLNAIIGFAEVLRDGICGELTPEQVDPVVDIHESGVHLLRMINDILDLSKVEAGKMELQAEDFSLLQAIYDVESIIRDIANKKRLNLSINVSDDLPDIHADPVRFKQIMYNLLSNAAKFTPVGGEITMEASLDGNEFLISITDTGIGIKPEDQSTIFDEFMQLDSSKSRQYEGTGLGLALTKRLVTLHGGRIWVESEGNGKGSKFSFTVPNFNTLSFVQNGEISGKETALNALSNLTRKTILIVEDNPHASQLLCIYLSEAGYNTVVAADGDEALQIAREIRPFAITLDIMLPKKDGWHVLQELKSLPETQNIPVVIISIVDDQHLGFNMGAVGYLVKPMDRMQLINIMDKLELSSKAENQRVRILVIDDRTEDLNLTEAILVNEGYDVLKAFDGTEGVSKAIDEFPDLIILDLIMPGMSGFDVVKTLQEHPQARDIPIVICTVKDLNTEELKTLNNGVESIVKKGEDAKYHLLGAVRKIEQFQKTGEL